MSADFFDALEIFFHDNQKTCFSKTEVFRLFTVDDLRKRGMIFNLLNRDDIQSIIDEIIYIDEIIDFLIKYYNDCIALQDDGYDDYIMSRYQAGWDIARLFNHLMTDQHSNQNAITKLKRMIMQHWQNDDKDIKIFVETAILEHLVDGLIPLF